MGVLGRAFVRGRKVDYDDGGNVDGDCHFVHTIFFFWGAGKRSLQLDDGLYTT